MSAEQLALATERRAELVEKVADVDEHLGELFLMEEPIDEPTLREAIRWVPTHVPQALTTTLTVSRAQPSAMGAECGLQHVLSCDGRVCEGLHSEARCHYHMRISCGHSRAGDSVRFMRYRKRLDLI